MTRRPAECCNRIGSWHESEWLSVRWRKGIDVMTDPGPDGSGVGAEGRVGDPKMPPAKERAEDRDAKGLQDHGDAGADEPAQASEAERIAQQPDF